MSVRLLSFGGCLGLAALVWGASVAEAAPATPRMRPPGRSIEFSQPKTDEVSTNLSELAKPRGDGLLQLEKSLRGQSDFLKQDSFSDAPVPYNYPTIIVPNKRRMEQLERQRDWGSMTPEQLLLGTSDNPDSLNPSGNKEKPLSKQGDPYRTERQSSTLNPGTMREDDPLGSRRRQQTDSAGRDSSGLLPGVRDQDDSSLRRLFGVDTDSGFSSSGQFGRGAGSAAFNFSGERNGYFSRELHQQRMEQFKRALEGMEPTPVFPSASFGTPGGLDSLAGSLPQVVIPKSEPVIRPLYGQIDSVESRYSPLPTLPGGAPEPKSFGQFDQWVQRPKLQPQPQPVTAPQVPSFSPPKRPFM